MWGAEHRRGGERHPPLSEPSKRGLVGGGPWVPAPRGCHQEAARPLTGEHAPTPPATGPSCGNGDSTRLQVHEQLSASANPLPKCDVGSAHGEQTQQKLRCRDGNTAPVSFQSSLLSPNLIVTPLLQLRSTAPFPPHLESGWPTSGSKGAPGASYSTGPHSPLSLSTPGFSRSLSHWSLCPRSCSRGSSHSQSLASAPWDPVGQASGGSVPSIIWLFTWLFLWVPGSRLHTIPPLQGSASGESQERTLSSRQLGPTHRPGQWAARAGVRSPAGETC